MICPICGSAIAEGTFLCETCREKNASTLSAGTASPEYKGFGGWLILFWIGTMIISPIALIVNTDAEVRIVFHYSSVFPAWRQFVAVVSLGNLVTAIFSMAVGLFVAFSVRGCRRFVLAFIGVQLLWHTIRFSLPFLISAAPKALQNTWVRIYAMSIPQSAAYAFIWGLYWLQSKRVRNTFGEI